MADTQDVAVRKSTGVQQQVQERASELATRPPADIFEDADSITLTLDMPGVAKERLNLSMEQNNLVVEGRADVSAPEGMMALYADVRSTLYRRSFALSGELVDTDNIDANLKDGVLSIRIPKRAELRPRKIEVRVN